MTVTMLDASKVQRMIEEKGLKQTWVISQIGLKRTTGFFMLREGLLPKDAYLRKSALEKLARLLGVDERQLILRLEAKRAI